MKSFEDWFDGQGMAGGDGYGVQINYRVSFSREESGAHPEIGYGTPFNESVPFNYQVMRVSGYISSPDGSVLNRRTHYQFVCRQCNFIMPCSKGYSAVSDGYVCNSCRPVSCADGLQS